MRNNNEQYEKLPVPNTVLATILHVMINAKASPMRDRSKVCKTSPTQNPLEFSAQKLLNDDNTNTKNMELQILKQKLNNTNNKILKLADARTSTQVMKLSQK